MSNDISFNPTVGNGIDAGYVEGRLEMAAIDPLHNSIVRQRITLDNASISAGRKRVIEQRLSVRYKNQIKVMNKRLNVLSKIPPSKITKDQIEEKAKLSEQLKSLQERIKSEVEIAQGSDRVINNIKRDNNTLNTVNHASSGVLFTLSPRLGNYFNLIVQETDKTSEDLVNSASAGTSPAGLLMGQYNPMGALAAMPGFMPGFHRFAN